MSRPTINWNSASRDYGMVQFEQDSDLVVIFYTKSVRDQIASLERGMPIHRDVPYVKIFRPGEQINVIDRPVEPGDKSRFARQWQQYLENQEQVPEGTPIDLLFPNNPAIADMLRGHGIHTIQQCANLTAHAIDRIGMGGQEYVNRSKKYIEAASSGESFIKIQEELKKKNQAIYTLEQQVQTLRSQLDSVLSKLGQAPAHTNVNPISNTVEVPFQKNYDPQSERINATHKTADLKKSKSFKEVVNKNVIEDFDE